LNEGVLTCHVDCSDAFTRREAASEEMWIRNEEKAKLLQLKEKLQKQKEHIDKLSQDM
jgi:ATPase inhibitor, mitochondrial